MLVKAVVYSIFIVCVLGYCYYACAGTLLLLLCHITVITANKILIVVVAGRNLIAKNGSTSDPYLEVSVLNDNSERIGKVANTNVLKGDLNPSWNQTLELYVIEVEVTHELQLLHLLITSSI